MSRFPKPPEMVFLVPAPGCMVRDPITHQFLPDTGDWKPRDMYWNRRISMVDVLEADPPQPSSPAGEPVIVMETTAVDEPSPLEERRVEKHKRHKKDTGDLSD